MLNRSVLAWFVRFGLFAGLLVTKLGAQETVNAPLVFYASSSGQQTLDQGEGGGNPFASALIELMGHENLTLRDFPKQLAELTAQKSRDRQLPQVPDRLQLVDWQFTPKPEGERRLALVLVYSDYSASGGAKSLPGAKRDAQRLTEALERAGFETQKVIDPDRSSLSASLTNFTRRSKDADIGLVYTTGHGVEVAGSVYLLPGDYPIARQKDALADFAIPIAKLSATPHARRANFVFYGGCRDNPF
jgi:Caspase domain